MKVLVAKCFNTKCVFAHVVPQKGVDPERYAVDRLVKDATWLGHSKLVLRSDNEPAIQKLLSETLKTLKVDGLNQVVESHPPAYDPSSNGAIEVACKGVGGMLRTLKSDLEDRLGYRVPVSHPMFAWMTEHAPWLMTIRPRLDNGRSPHHLARGTRFTRELLCFAEMCHFKLPPSKLSGQLEGKLAPRWKSGVFLGYSRDSHEYVVWNPVLKELKMSRTLQRLPEREI